MVREISSEEVKKHSDSKSVWIIINNDVYDVTSFLEEHPGGADSLLDVAGKDGTQGFEDVGHSADARELLKKYKIGTLPSCEIIKKIHSCSTCCLNPSRSSEKDKTWRTYDGSPKSRSQSPRSSERSIPCETLKSEKRIQKVVVPRERKRIQPCERRRPPAPSSSKWKWAIIALAGAIVIGFTLKKYLS